MKSYKGTHTIEYGFGRDGYDPDRIFVVEVDYTVTFGHPGSFNPMTGVGDPPEGDDVEFDTPRMFAVCKDGSYDRVPQEVRDYFLFGWDGRPYVEEVLAVAYDEIESIKTRAAEERAERHGV